MKKIVIAAALVTMLGAAGCSSSEAAPSKPTHGPTKAAPAFDRDAEKKEAFTTALDSIPSGVKVHVCDAAKKDGQAGVKKYITSDEYPFVAEDPAYEASMWVKYCAGKMK